MDWPRSEAASFKASQNGASSEIDVLCPAILNERLTGLTARLSERFSNSALLLIRVALAV